MNATPPTISRFFTAMQAGAAARTDMMNLFADHAVYVEPFSGKALTHDGKQAILSVMEAGWAHPMPDMRITVDRVDVDGDRVIADWTCHSPALPGGKGRGQNRFTLKGGLIVRLETTLVPDAT